MKTYKISGSNDVKMYTKDVQGQKTLLTELCDPE